MVDTLTAYLNRHDFFILTTHDPADADGIGAQLILACILRLREKRFRIINASSIPKHFRFMDTRGIIEQWDEERHRDLPEQAGLILVDTADESHIGAMKDIIHRSKGVFAIDHHDHKPDSGFSGISDSSAASTCELAVELAQLMGVAIDPEAAFAAYIGIAYDTGFFAYSKTGPRTLRSALALLELGVNPYNVYQKLHENASVGMLLLQKRALAGLTLHYNNRVAVQVLRLTDFAKAGALPEETDGFVNFPLKARDIVVSLMFKESAEGKIRCSLRSKGSINVAKIAQEFKGGGHVNAAGLKSSLSIEQTMEQVLGKVAEHLDKP